MIQNCDKELINACKNKGLEMSIETASQYRELIVLNKDYIILEHMPTGTEICSYLKEPDITQNINNPVLYWGFKER